ncbi:MAG: tripartite tricarboxylate transporter substrate binding protein [Burkholderiales bacterium]|nr:tripartite tricarboxylate transporter substrate binding protein [Burkholderiales bacterium]
MTGDAPMKRWMACAALALVAGMPVTAAAQAWPAKPVRIVVSYPPGGGADATARLLGPKLADALGVSVVIENRQGSGGVIGGDAVAKAAPDGYTFLLDASSHSINPVLQPKMPFDTLKDLVPVSMLLVVPNMLVVHPTFAAGSVKELVALVKSKPGQFSFASSGNGSAQHLAAELFKAQAGLFMVHIPYRGGGPALIDVMGGQVPIYFGNMASASPHVRAGKLKALAVTGSKRSPAMPALPTIAESGLPGYEVYEWNAIFAPAGTPAEIVQRMQSELARALALPDVRERLAGMGAEPVGGMPAELDRTRRAEIAKWTGVIKRAGIRLD